jgi:cytochrome c553
MLRKQYIITISLGIFIMLCIAFVQKTPASEGEKPTFIPPSSQRNGDSGIGYQYLITGDYLKSGLPYNYFALFYGKDKQNFLNRTGKNANVPYGFNVVQSDNYTEVVVPTCLQCHAQEFEGKLYVGLGNTFQDFTTFGKGAGYLNNMGSKVLQTFSPKQYQATKAIVTSFSAIAPYMQTEVQGVNAADRLATLLVAHRDPQTLEWLPKPILDIPNEVVPTDVPAWWLLKKKNAMFYNGFGRGDFGKFMMLSNILTVKDTSEASEVNSHFGDVLAFIKSIEPPKYTKEINKVVAAKGKTIFTNTCSKCHGTYGEDGKYPNLLIPASIIKTDSMLYLGNQQNPQFIDWFNKSWFAKGENPARLEPYNGYIAPPLDGVWITAPYLHNGSVPTLQALLNSKERPQYWKRNFKNATYDYTNIGWNYETVAKPEKRTTYNTDLAGYRNIGHTFGDKLSDTERKAVIEYLKML